MRDIKTLLDFWEAHPHEPLILATIIRKHQSGYRTLGAKKIISEKDACGLLSGGCLEVDINNTARQAWDRLPFIQSFSTLDSTLFGYQAGCAGVLDILFERISSHTLQKSLYIPYGNQKLAKGVAVGIGKANLGQRQWIHDTIPNASFWFYEPWIEPIQLYVIGCGPDAPALIEMAQVMGWQITLLDYRPDYVVTESSILSPIQNIASYIPERPHVAVVLMTHNYEADLQILRHLNGKQIGYLGCLGPKQRFEQLKMDLWHQFGVSLSAHLQTISHAPAGLFPRGRSPEEIALSIVAEIQSVFRMNHRELACMI